MNNREENCNESNNALSQATGDNDSNEQKTDSNPDWTWLPEPAVDQIYSFLGRNDQCHLSLICKRWSSNYSSPCLWRSIKFYLPEEVYSGDIYPEIKFARKYGHFFRNLEIICKRVKSQLIDEIYTQFRLFLEALTSNNDQLHSVKFINIIKYFRYLEENDYLALLETTKTFLEAQTKLRSLEFRETYYRRDEGADILNKACQDNSGNLKSLIIKGFVSDPVIEEEAPQPQNIPVYRSLTQHLMNINYIQTDYSQLLEKLLQPPPNNAVIPAGARFNGKLSLLDVACEASKRLRYQGISPDTWRIFKRVCPNLRVNMSLTAASHPRSDFRFFIVDHLPLQNLEFRVETPHENRNLSIDELFQHLRDTRCLQNLENLTIVWMPLVEDLSISLTANLQIAAKLRTLQIVLRYPVEGIEDLFKSWVDNRPPSLESAHISITRVRQTEDCDNIMRISDEYSPILQVLGLNVILVADTL